MFVEGPARASALAGCFFGGLVAAEGCFGIVQMSARRRDGSLRLRFVLSLKMAAWDRPLLTSLQRFLGAGAVNDFAPRKPGWQPTASFTISGRFTHNRVTIPFAEGYLPRASQKWQQFLHWRGDLRAYEARHPSQWGKGPSTCSVPDCPDPVRGRGCCRRHYYRETGY
jgi:hypothetical protein